MPSQRTQQPSTIPATYIRGGTSRAVFFHESNLPPAGSERDKLLLRLMGSPNRTQIDGIGGATTHTSKIAIVRASQRDEADIDWTHAQVGIETPQVTYTGGCGNISSAVAAFAVNEGWAKTKPTDGKVEVRIFHTGSESVIRAYVPVEEETGKALETGDCSISGVLGTGAPIDMDYSLAIGGTLHKGALPTGNILDEIEFGNQTVPVTVCDAGNLFLFASAAAFGLTGSEGEAELDSKPGLFDALSELRGKAAQKLGMCKHWQTADEDSPSLPGGLLVCLVSPPTDGQSNIQSRLLVGQHFHSSMAGTCGVCTAACSRIKGSIVNSTMTLRSAGEERLVIQHPSGILPVAVKIASEDVQSPVPSFEILSFVRTARYIFRGEFFVPEDVYI